MEMSYHFIAFPCWNAGIHIRFIFFLVVHGILANATFLGTILRFDEVCEWCQHVPLIYLFPIVYWNTDKPPISHWVLSIFGCWMRITSTCLWVFMRCPNFIGPQITGCLWLHWCIGPYSWPRKTITPPHAMASSPSQMFHFDARRPLWCTTLVHHLGPHGEFGTAARRG